MQKITNFIDKMSATVTRENDKNKNKPKKQKGVNFIGLLTLMFVAFKLLGVITWSWWFVLCPVWGMALLGIVYLIFLTLEEDYK